MRHLCHRKENPATSIIMRSKLVCPLYDTSNISSTSDHCVGYFFSTYCFLIAVILILYEDIGDVF